MKIQVQYCESFRTFLRYGEYDIDSKNFPELEDMTGEEVTQWISENMEELFVKDNDNGNPEIVPFDGDLQDLSSDAMERGVTREKILDNDSWFEYTGDGESEKEEPEDE